MHGDAYRKRTPSGDGVPGEDGSGLTDMDTWSKKDLVGGFGWSHIRDDGDERGEEDGEERRRGIDAAVAVGVG